MKCDCGGRTRVLDSRGDYRRRECLTCGIRFSTEEVVVIRHPVREQAKQVVVKKRPYMPRTKAAALPNTQEQLTKNTHARRRIEEMLDNLRGGGEYEY